MKSWSQATKYASQKELIISPPSYAIPDCADFMKRADMLLGEHQRSESVRAEVEEIAPDQTKTFSIKPARYFGARLLRSDILNAARVQGRERAGSKCLEAANVNGRTVVWYESAYEIGVRAKGTVTIFVDRDTVRILEIVEGVMLDGKFTQRRTVYTYLK